MIQREKVRKHEIDNEFVQQTITGKVDDILHMKRPVELDSIFTGISSDSKVVLIEGAPGAGKSSLSLNICKKWSTEELFKEYIATILVRLRDPCIQSATCIAELLPHCDKELSKAVETTIIATQGESILWVLDGWDEFPEQLKKDEQCLVQNLICKQNHRSSVIVTSRPISSVSLYPLVSKRIEILGFTPNELQLYFEHRLQGDSASVKVLLNKIKEYPEVQSSCYLPLHAGFIADTFLMKHDLPSTQFGIFESVIVKCISRYQIKQGKAQSEITSLDDLDCKLQKSMLAICQLAYKGILENKIIFTENDLPGSDFKSLDLLQEVESMVAFKGVSKTYNFLHLSIQEFLAAQGLAKRPLYEQYWLFKGLMDEDRCLPMLTFYAAKTKLSAPGVADFVSKVGDRYLQARNEHEQEQLCGLLAFVIKCICETEDPTLCKPLVKALGKNICSLSHIYDYYSLGSFLSLSTCTSLGTENRIMIGDIKRLTMQESEWALFVKGLLRFYKGKCISSLETTTLSVSPTDPILGLLHSTDLLYVPHICIQNNFRKERRRFRVRHLSDILAPREEVVMCKQSEHSLNRQYSLDISVHRDCPNMLKQNCNISCIEFQKIAGCCRFVAEGLLSNSTLRELRFSECSISSEEFQCLSDALCKNKFVHVLDIFKCHLENTAQNLSNIFQSNITLQELKLQRCNISSHDLSLITSFGQLKTLVLSHNLFGNKGAKCLSKTLQDNKCLHKLILTECGITEKGSIFLLQIFQRGTLKSLSTLNHISFRQAVINQRLNLDSIPSFNKESLLQLFVDNDAGKVLERFIKHNYPCQSLVISSKGLDFSIISSIFEALKKNSNLTYFHIKTSLVNDTNLKTIAESLQENKSLTVVFLDCRLTVQYSKTPQLSHTSGYHHYPSEESFGANISVSQVGFSRTSVNDPYARIKEGLLSSRSVLQVNTLYKYMLHCLRSNVSLKYLILPNNCDTNFFHQHLRGVTVINCDHFGIHHGIYESQFEDNYSTSHYSLSSMREDPDNLFY